MRVIRSADHRPGPRHGRARGSRRRRHGALPKDSGKHLTVAFGDAATRIRVGDVEIPCYVLSSGQRVVTEDGVRLAIGIGPVSPHSLADLVPALLGQGTHGPKPLSSMAELVNQLRAPLKFVPLEGPPILRGYDVTVLRALADMVLSAGSDSAAVNPHVVQLSRVIDSHIDSETGEDWLVDAVDRATGFDIYNQRARLAYGLEGLVHPGVLKWLDLFPDEYFRSFWVLRGAHAYGFATLDLVFLRLHMSDLVELAQTLPRTTDGRGNMTRVEERFRQHVAGVTALMKASPDWATFLKLMDRAFGKVGGGVS